MLLQCCFGVILPEMTSFLLVAAVESTGLLTSIIARLQCKNLTQDKLVLGLFEFKCGFETSPAQALTIQMLFPSVIVFL